jgi:hypothetical protein
MAAFSRDSVPPNDCSFAVDECRNSVLTDPILECAKRGQHDRYGCRMSLRACQMVTAVARVPVARAPSAERDVDEDSEI